MAKLFPTYEVGSLPKLNARVKATRGQALSDAEIAEVNKLGSRFQVDTTAIVDLLERQRIEARILTSREKAEVIDFNALLYLRLQESIGLDFVYDGEARRAEMYRHVARRVDGFENTPEMIRSRGPDSWRMAICVSPPNLKEGSLDGLVVKEFDFVQKHAKNPIKVPIDDPYMIAVMSDNRYFMEKFKGRYPEEPRKLRYEAKREFTLSLAENVIRPQVEAVVARGARWVQLDIPAATLDIEHIPIMVEGVNSIIDGIEDVKFSLHICYPRRVSLTEKKGYALLFPHILQLHPSVNHLSLELANADQYEQDLAVFAQHNQDRKFELGVGVIDITLEQQQRGAMESPEVVRERIIRASEALGDPALVYVAPDCGLRQLKLDRCLEIYDVLVTGTELARKG